MNTHRLTNLRWTRWVAPLGVALILTACGDLFDVKNPGRIEDADLNTLQGIEALVTGMSSDFSSSYDESSFAGARLSDEAAGSGSYNTTGFLRRGIIFVDSEFDFLWEGMQRARWVAEAGLERMRAIEGFDFNSSELTARAYLLAGLANRWMGENFCYSMFDDPTQEGEDPENVQDKAAAFNRAIPHLQSAISIGTAAGDDDIVTAANGALAQIYMGLGDWAQATAFASQVPTDFTYVAFYDGNSGREENVMWNETHGRQEMSAFGTLAGSFAEPGDVRAPYQDCGANPDGCNNANGADGSTLHLMQQKYPDVGSDIPLVQGTEMRLIEAEAALVGGDLQGFVDAVNAARAEWGITPIDLADVTGGTVGPSEITGDWASMNAWDVLDRERFLETWLEGRRLWDLHRWDHPFLDGGSVVYEPEPGARRASCFPVADSECQTNPAIRGTDVCR